MKTIRGEEMDTKELFNGLVGNSDWFRGLVDGNEAFLSNDGKRIIMDMQRFDATIEVTDDAKANLRIENGYGYQEIADVDFNIGGYSDFGDEVYRFMDDVDCELSVLEGYTTQMA